MSSKEKLKAILSGNSKVAEFKIKRPQFFHQYKGELYNARKVFFEERGFQSIAEAEAYCNRNNIKIGHISYRDGAQWIETGRAYTYTGTTPETTENGIVWDCETPELLFVDEIPKDTSTLRYLKKGLLEYD